MAWNADYLYGIVKGKELTCYFVESWTFCAEISPAMVEKRPPLALERLLIKVEKITVK